jgi:hypothetical protein
VLSPMLVLQIASLTVQEAEEARVGAREAEEGEEHGPLKSSNVVLLPLEGE